MAESLKHFKNVMAHKFFVRPADHDYTISRWAFCHGYFREFYWNGLQAIEKYCKATLICNGQSVIKHGHDISNLYCKVDQLLPDLLSCVIVAPKEIRTTSFKAQITQSFIEQVEGFGHPDTRYGQRSYHAKLDDLMKLDYVCFNLTRAAISLDCIVGEDWEPKEFFEVPGQSYHSIIMKHRNFQVYGEIDIPETPAEDAKSNVRDVIHRFNFAFRGSSDDMQRQPSRGLTENSYLYLLSELLESPNPDRVTIDGTRWLIDSIKLSQSTRVYFEDRVKHLP